MGYTRPAQGRRYTTRVYTSTSLIPRVYGNEIKFDSFATECFARLTPDRAGNFPNYLSQTFATLQYSPISLSYANDIKLTVVLRHTQMTAARVHPSLFYIKLINTNWKSFFFCLPPVKVLRFFEVVV